jgi:hypothetical protein
MSNHRFFLPRPVRRGPSPEELEKVKAVLLLVMRHGMTFRPWLVTRDGEVVGELPCLADDHLMRAHRFYKENHDAKRVQAPETNPAA